MNLIESWAFFLNRFLMSRYLASDYISIEITIFSEALLAGSWRRNRFLRKGPYLNLKFFLYDKSITDRLLITARGTIFWNSKELFYMKRSSWPLWLHERHKVSKFHGINIKILYVMIAKFSEVFTPRDSRVGKGFVNIYLMPLTDTEWLLV